MCDEFKEISRRLSERPNTIEDLTETREFMNTIPEIVTEHQKMIDAAVSDYAMLDEYFFPLTDDGFDMKSVNYTVHTVTCYIQPCALGGLLRPGPKELLMRSRKLRSSMKKTRISFRRTYKMTREPLRIVLTHLRYAVIPVTQPHPLSPLSCADDNCWILREHRPVSCSRDS